MGRTTDSKPIEQSSMKLPKRRYLSRALWAAFIYLLVCVIAALSIAGRQCTFSGDWLYAALFVMSQYSPALIAGIALALLIGGTTRFSRRFSLVIVCALAAAAAILPLIMVPSGNGPCTTL